MTTTSTSTRAGTPPRLGTARQTAAAVVAVVFAVLLMHGIGNPTIAHGALPGLTHTTAMEPGHGHDQGACDDDACGHPGGMAMAAMNCAYAVIRPATASPCGNDGAAHNSVTDDADVRSLLRGPEPPVPRLA